METDNIPEISRVDFSFWYGTESTKGKNERNGRREK